MRKTKDLKATLKIGNFLERVEYIKEKQKVLDFYLEQHKIEPTGGCYYSQFTADLTKELMDHLKSFKPDLRNEKEVRFYYDNAKFLKRLQKLDIQYRNNLKKDAN